VELNRTLCFMSHHFHAGGAIAYERGVEAERRKVIKAGYADALATASWLERQMIRLGIWMEFREREGQRPSERQGHVPSPYTLW
jgi:hypothetical protein